MDALKIIGSVLFGLIIILLCGTTLVYNLNLWYTIQEFTTPIPEANQIAQETYQYFMDRSNTNFPEIHTFNLKENSHMYDVKMLIIQLELILLISLFILIGIIYHTKAPLEIFFKGASGTLVSFLLLLIIPFHKIFIGFHQIFFEPGTWVFTSGMMVQAFTTEFFMWMAQLYWLRVVGSAAIIALLCFILIRFKNHKDGNI